MRLELGAGYRPTPGFTHNDLREMDDIEIVGPAESISDVVQENSCSEVRATHLLEHLSFLKTVDVLMEWKKILRDGGLLYLEVPNLSWQTRAHADGHISDEEAVTYIYGEQDYDGNYHCAAFTESLLADRLREAGYVDVRTQDIGQVICAWSYKP